MKQTIGQLEKPATVIHRNSQLTSIPKKKIEREGVVRDMKRTVYFEPQTQKRRKRLVRAIKMNFLRMIGQGLVKSEK